MVIHYTLLVFSHEGPARSPRLNAILAGYLAGVAGFVNSTSFILIGLYTSHVTGSVGRFAHDLALHDHAAAGFAACMVLSFFGGAFFASFVLEASPFIKVSRAYGIVLFCQGVLQALFLAWVASSPSAGVRMLDSQAWLLCFTMGMQNSLVTRLSGAVVRTTHLTGVITDLGIEAARWLAWKRSQWKLVPILFTPRRPANRPDPIKVTLLLAISSSFITGSVLGAVLCLKIHVTAMVFPTTAIFLASGYAFWDPER